MEVKQEDMYKIKLEELIIKDEYISDPDSNPGSPSVLAFFATPTDREDCVNTHHTNKQLELENYSDWSETTSSITDVKFNQCNGCNLKSSYKGSLKMHRAKCEIKFQQEYSCAHFCNSTKRKCDLKTHPKKKSFDCEQCDFKTKYHHSLKLHMLTHTGEKPHQCKQCDFKTCRKSHLKRHMLTHSGEKPYQCKRCDFKTSRKDNLKQHMVRHSSEKPYQCKQCDFKTSLRGHLRQHMLTHSGEKSHHCVQCDFKTSRKGILKQHMLRHSGVKSNHSEVTHSLHKKEYSTNSFNEGTKDSKKFILDPEIIKEECGVLNYVDFIIKEEPNDSAL